MLSPENASTYPVQKRVFVQRDYTQGMVVRFQTRFPSELDDRIELDKFVKTVEHLNVLYAEAEKVSASTYCEGCLACLTGYLLYVCMETHYEKVLKKIARYIHEQNKTVYWPHGVIMKDPYESGLRSRMAAEDLGSLPEDGDMIRRQTSHHEAVAVNLSPRVVEPFRAHHRVKGVVINGNNLVLEHSFGR